MFKHRHKSFERSYRCYFPWFSSRFGRFCASLHVELRKKLAEIQALEERLQGGAQLSIGQIKKIESKAWSPVVPLLINCFTIHGILCYT